MNGHTEYKRLQETELEEGLVAVELQGRDINGKTVAVPFDTFATEQYVTDAIAAIPPSESGTFQGTITLSSTPTADGLYIPTEAGAYVNAGGLVYAPATTDANKIIQFSKKGTVWTKISIPITATESPKISQLKYNEYFVNNEFGSLSVADGNVSGTSTTRARSSAFVPLDGGIYGVEVIAPIGFEALFIITYKNGVFVRSASIIGNLTIDSATENQIKIVVKKTSNAVITPTELSQLQVVVYNTEKIKYLELQKRLRDIEKLDVPLLKTKVDAIDSYNLSDVVLKTNQLKYNRHSNQIVYGGLSLVTSSDAPVDNNLRLRDSVPSKLKSGTINISTQSNFGLYPQVYKGYKDGVFVPNAFTAAVPTSFVVDENIINGIRIAFRKLDNTAITQIEKDDLKVTITNPADIGYSDIKEDISTLQEESKSFLKSTYYGKKFTVMGDSISYGFIPRNYPGYPGQLNSYAKIAATKLGMVFTNNGISGSTLGSPIIGAGTNSPFVYRVDAIPLDQELIVVMGGTNDIRKGVVLGTFSDTTEVTYYGALHVLCLSLIDRFKISQGTTIGSKNKIVFCTPIKMGTDLTPDLKPYCNAVKEVCAYYSIPVWDAYNLSGINPHIFRNVVGTEVGYTENYNPYITDGTHPTQEGHEIMSNAFIGFLNTIN